jgi:putative membrane protein
MTLNAALALCNASLTTVSTGCMIAGFRAIKRKEVRRHKRFMLTAFVAAAAFMTLFAVRFATFGFRKYPGHGVLHGIYLAIFFTHEPIAVVSVPLVIAAAGLGLARSYAAHREVAEWAFPIWLYASVTGVLIYVLLYAAS